MQTDIFICIGNLSTACCAPFLWVNECQIILLILKIKQWDCWTGCASWHPDHAKIDDHRSEAALMMVLSVYHQWEQHTETFRFIKHFKSNLTFFFSLFIMPFKLSCSNLSFLKGEGKSPFLSNLKASNVFLFVCFW